MTRTNIFSSLLIAPLVISFSIATAAEPVAQWKLAHLKDAMTDEITERASITSGGSVLLMSCWPAQKDIGIQINVAPATSLSRLRSEVIEYVGIYYAMVVRLDDGPPMESLWTKSGNTITNSTTILRESDGSTDVKMSGPELLDRMLAAKRMRLRAFDKINGTNVDIDFNISGIYEAAENLKIRCGL